MKQMKIFLVAVMALMMGISVTSCMKGDENTVVPVYGIISIKNTIPYEFQVDGGGVTFASTAMTINGLSSDATYNDVVFLSAQYDTKTQAVDQNTKKIIVDVNFAVKLNSKTYTDIVPVKTDASDRSNRSIIPLGRYSGAVPSMYATKWIIMPSPYFTEKAENTTKHSFSLVYYEDEAIVGETLKLYLYHNSEEEASKETVAISSSNPYEVYKAFDVSYILSKYKANNSNKAPQKIVVVVQEQKGQSTEITGADSYTESTYNVEDYKAAE